MERLKTHSLIKNKPVLCLAKQPKWSCSRPCKQTNLFLVAELSYWNVNKPHWFRLKLCFAPGHCIFYCEQLSLLANLRHHHRYASHLNCSIFVITSSKLQYQEVDFSWIRAITWVSFPLSGPEFIPAHPRGRNWLLVLHVLLLLDRLVRAVSHDALQNY